MTPLTFVVRSLTHYWRGNLVVVLGVAVAVAVLAGALLVGDSVRGTLRDLAFSRLGATDLAVVSTGFFRDGLAADLAADATFREAFENVAPIVAVEGFVTVQTSGLRAGKVRVYGVDERFWRFHGLSSRALEARQAFVSPALADEIGAGSGVAILVRVERPSDVPIESLHGRKDDPGRSMRAVVQSVLAAEELGEFSLAQEQGRIRAVFLPLAWLREQLEIGARANTLVVAARDGPAASSAALAAIVQRRITSEDAGLTFRALADDRVVVVGADAGLLDEAREAAVERAAVAVHQPVERVLTYLANTIRVGDREVPYSLVTALDLPVGTPPAVELALPPIVFNTWLAQQIGAKVGDEVELTYYAWVDPGQLETKAATFRFTGVRPIGPDDRHLAPQYPGITDSPTLDAWDPPFPLDLRRVRPVDEAYWRDHRTTPKAFVSLADGQRLWGSRYGRLTSMRVSVDTGQNVGEAVEALRRATTSALALAASGVSVRDVRGDALAASQGVTDFGEYFVYFSFFLVVSALVLAALFFKLGVDERARQIGLLGAVGASPGVIHRLFLSEGLVLAGVGGAIGAGASVAYAAAITSLLRTWWVDAVGTSALELHVSVVSVAIGVAGGVLAALACTWFALRHLSRLSPRALVAGLITREETMTHRRGGQRRRLGLALVLLTAGVASAAAAWARLLAPAGAFFGAAVCMLAAGLFAIRWWYARPHTRLLDGHGSRAMVRLGARNASAAPSRSVLAIAVMASAVFILLAVDVFRKDAISDTGPSSGVGGYAFIAESLLPLAHDLGTPAGREAAGVTGVNEATFEPFRLRPGDDTSCLNLYQPSNPRVLGVPQSFIEQGRFRFSGSLAATEAERANPWTLLTTMPPDGTVPVIADANSLTYVLHKAVGDIIEIPHRSGVARLRVVAALADSLFQGELLVGEVAFRRLFPEHGGYRFWLIETPAGSMASVAGSIEQGLAAFGVDVLPSTDRLAEFHRVENTYLATFQTLGGLGLLLGTFGLSAVLLRNVVERRRELALLGAVGFSPGRIRLTLLAESLSLLLAGVAVGLVAALVASVPAAALRGGRLPFSAVALVVVAAVIVAGVLSTAVAARAATRQPLLEALRSE